MNNHETYHGNVAETKLQAMAYDAYSHSVRQSERLTWAKLSADDRLNWSRCAWSMCEHLGYRAGDFPNVGYGDGVMPTATVILFKPSGKYHTEEEWEIPERACGPYDMIRSKDFRRIAYGPVLVVTQEPWGYPHLLS